MGIAACFNLDCTPLNQEQVAWLGFRDGQVHPTERTTESRHMAGCIFSDKYYVESSENKRSNHYVSRNGTLLVDGKIHHTIAGSLSCKKVQCTSAEIAFRMSSNLESNPVEAVRQVSGEFGLLYFNWRTLSLFAAVDYRSTSFLFHCRFDNAIYISSELGHLLHRPGNTLALDVRFIALYLTTIYHRQSPSSFRLTPYAGIEAIPPGCSLEVSPDRVSEVDYYAGAVFPNEEALDTQVCAESLLEHFKKAVACRIENAERVCISVSGGLDSSAILAVAAQDYASNNEKVCAVTFYHDGVEDFEEREWARLVLK